MGPGLPVSTVGASTGGYGSPKVGGGASGAPGSINLHANAAWQPGQPFTLQNSGASAPTATQQAPPGGRVAVTYQEVHFWLSAIQMDDAKIQEGARGIAMFCAFGDPEQQRLLLMQAAHDVTPLVKALDGKKRLCGTKQAAMEAIGQLALLHDAYWSDFLQKGAVALLVKKLRCEQGRCQLAALVCLHRLLVLGGHTAGNAGSSADTTTSPGYAPVPVVAAAAEPKKKGGLLKMASTLKDKSKLARNMGRLVAGTGTADLPQQLCDAGAVETLVLMVSGDRSLQHMAVDVLLAVARHQNRVHHLSKRGAVEVAASLLACCGDQQLQLKGLTLLTLLTDHRPVVVAEKGLREGNVDRAFAADATKLLGVLLHDSIPELSCGAASALVLLADTSAHMGLLATHGGLVERLLAMCFESTAHKATALRALEQLSRDETGTAQRWIVEAGAVPRLLQLVVPRDADLEVTLGLLCLLANTPDHQQKMISEGTISKVLEAVTAARDPACTCMRAAQLLAHLAPYRNPDTQVSYLVEDGGLRPLVGMLGVQLGECRAAAATALAELASHSQDNREAIAGLGGIQTLVQGLQQDPGYGVKAPFALALASLAESDEHKATIGASGAISVLVAMLSPACPEPAYVAAVAALVPLSRHDSNRMHIVSSNGLPPLVALLDKNAAAATSATLVLQQMASNAEFTGKVAQANALPALLRLAESPVSGCCDEAINVIRQLAEVAELRDAVVATKGSTAVLIRTLGVEAQSTEAKADSMAALECIALDPKHRPTLVAEGAIAPTATLLTAEGWPCPDTAAWLLCRLAQVGEEAHNAVFHAPGVLLHLKAMLADESADIGPRTAAAAALGALATHGNRFQEAVAGDGTLWLLGSLLGNPQAQQAAACTAAKALSNITSANPDLQCQAVESNILDKVVVLLSAGVSEPATRAAAARTASNLMYDSDTRRTAMEADALTLLTGLLLDADADGKAAAGLALGQLLKDSPQSQQAFASSQGLAECLSLLRQGGGGAGEPAAAAAHPGAVLAACRVLFALVGSPALYSSLDPKGCVSSLLALLQHRDGAVADAAAQTVGTMAQANPVVRAKLAEQVPALTKLLADKTAAGPAVAVLRALATVDPGVCESLAKSKPTTRAVQKLTERAGTQTQDDAIKLWKVLAEAGAQ